MSLDRILQGLPPSEERLLPVNQLGIEMADLGAIESQEQGASSSHGESNAQAGPASKSTAQNQERYSDNPDHETTDPVVTREVSGTALVASSTSVVYRVYKRRWFGLMQLVLLNIIISWDWLTYAPVTNTTAAFFDTTPTAINWLSTGVLFAFSISAPFTIYALYHSGPRLAIIVASVLILVGNWLRYAAVRTSPPSFPLAMFAQVIIGLAQPFVLSAPTRYSDLWFSPQGRVSATAVASLANPFGGALGQLIDPFLVNVPSDIPNMTLYVAIISSVATVPSFFIPARPPTPVSPSSTHTRPPILKQVGLLARSITFWLVMIPFCVLVGFFNSLSTLLVQILTPYNFSETDAGIAGAILIIVGLVSAAITSPIIDRSKRYLLVIKTLVPTIGICYLAFIWAPPSYSIVAPYIVCAAIGAASFSLLPVALEFLVEISWPVGPELSSTVLWSGGQILGGIFILISDALTDGPDAVPPNNMSRALIFQAIVALSVIPLALMIGLVGKEKGARNRRLEADKGLPGGTAVT